MLQQLVATLRVPDVHFMGHITNEDLTVVLRHRRRVRVRERTRGLLRAADGGVLQARSGGGVRGDGRARDDGRRGNPLLGQDPAARGAASSTPSWPTARSPSRSSQAQEAALARMLAKDFPGTLLALRRRGGAVARPGTSGRGVRLLGPVRRDRIGSRSCRSCGPRSTTPCRSPPGGPEATGRHDRPPVGARRRTAVTPSATAHGNSAICCAASATSPTCSR